MWRLKAADEAREQASGKNTKELTGGFTLSPLFLRRFSLLLTPLAL